MIIILDILTYLGVACALLGNIFIIKKKKFGYVVWLVGNVCVLPTYIIHADIPYIVLFATYAVLNVYGFYTWNKE